MVKALLTLIVVLILLILYILINILLIIISWKVVSWEDFMSSVDRGPWQGYHPSPISTFKYIFKILW